MKKLSLAALLLVSGCSGILSNIEINRCGTETERREEYDLDSQTNAKVFYQINSKDCMKKEWAQVMIDSNDGHFFIRYLSTKTTEEAYISGPISFTKSFPSISCRLENTSFNCYGGSMINPIDYSSSIGGNLDFNQANKWTNIGYSLLRK
jgi:hypothetical protein